MTYNELKDLLTDISNLMKQNKAVVSLELINDCRILLNQLRGTRLELNQDFSLDKIFKMLDTVLSIEEKLVGPTGDKITDTIDKLLKQPFLLTIIAKAIR